MTRSYFLDYVDTWDALLEFCRDENCDICEDIYDSEGIDDIINDSLPDLIRNEGWETVRDTLYDIPTGYDYYRCDGSFDYVGMGDDDDFDGYKEDVLNWMDDGGYWEDEDEEDDDEYEEAAPEPEDNEESPVESEDFSVNELFGMCFVSMTSIQKEEERKRQESLKELDAAFSELSNIFLSVN